MHSSFTRVSIHPRVTRNVANERFTCANKSQSKKLALAPLGTGNTNCLLAYSLHLVHTNASLHRIRLPPTGATTKRHTRWIRIYNAKSAFRLTRMHRWIARSPIFPTESYFILLPRYWYIKYINNGVRERERERVKEAQLSLQLKYFFGLY